MGEEGVPIPDIQRKPRLLITLILSSWSGLPLTENRDAELNTMRKSMGSTDKELCSFPAQQDGKFKVFDSPFGNDLVPVIPTCAEVDG
ncbi:hypothetical protein AAHA92_05757 [Salvia divinorum]|uniref:Uncharacterized protein n=1 Tax=Salvia divinorum TaxID=28513 RepID=A0ABD1I4K8_SALDI